MSQRYSKNAKRQKPRENQLEILKVYTFCRKSQQRASSPGESAAGVTFLSMRIQSKNFCIFPKKVAATLLSGSEKDAVGA